MNLDEELAQILAQLGVRLEEPEDAAAARAEIRTPGMEHGTGDSSEAAASADDGAEHETELSLFQTSREHYGVFYRLDLAAGTPQLRIYTPDDTGAVKVRCYLVRAAHGSPVREWFVAGRRHEGSAAYDDARDATEQHLLFAAGETLKRLFWAGDQEALCFAPEIEVSRLL